MPIVYSLISRGPVVLSEYELSGCTSGKSFSSHGSAVDVASYDGNYKHFTLRCLKTVATKENNCVVRTNQHEFCFEFYAGFTFVAVANDEYSRQIAFVYLDRIKSVFEDRYMRRSQSMGAQALHVELRALMQLQLDYCISNRDEMIKMAKVIKQVDEVKDIMAANIQTMVDNVQDVDALKDQAEQLEYSAQMFQVQATAYKRHYWWKSTLMRIALWSMGLTLALPFLLPIILPLLPLLILGGVVMVGTTLLFAPCILACAFPAAMFMVYRRSRRRDQSSREICAGDGDDGGSDSGDDVPDRRSRLSRDTAHDAKLSSGVKVE